MNNFFLLVIIFFTLNFNVLGDNLYIDNFNDGSSPNLLNGNYNSYGYRGGTGSVSYESNTCFGNSGKTLKLTYNVSVSNNSGVQLWMIISSQNSINFTNYDYLTFRIKGNTGNEMCRFMIRDTGNNYRIVDLRNYLPEGALTTGFQKVVIPLTAFRYDMCIATSITQVYFFIENGMGNNNSSIYIDEILLSTGPSPVYVDNVEVDEGTYDLSALTYNIYSGGNTEGALYYFAANYITNDSYSGSNSYFIQHITHRASSGDPWCQTVWMLGLNKTNVDISGCNRIKFRAKLGSEDTGAVKHLILGYYNGTFVQGSGHKDITSDMNSSWVLHDYPLSDFSGADLSKVVEFRFVTRWNGGYITNEIFIDDIIFDDTIPPQAPTNIRAGGLILSNNFTFFKGYNSITAEIFSNESLDSSLEGFVLEYRKNSGQWKIVDFDYNTDKSDFTNIWSIGKLTGTNNIDIRVSSIDSAGNISSAIYQNCSIVEKIDSFVVSLSNVDVNGIIDFGNVTNNNIPKIAQNNSGVFSFIKINYNIQTSPFWKIVIYTDNTNSSAQPRYIGSGDQLYGRLNDGTGLIGDGNGATNTHSTPIKVWCNAKYSDGRYAKAPCGSWKGNYSGLQGVPSLFYQGGETNLYWVNQDLNSNGTNDNIIETNTHWQESALNYDANGDGDLLDSSTGITGDALGRVFEYSSWMNVAGNNRVISGAETPVLIDNSINSSMPNDLKVYFAVTDDLAGDYKTDQLIIELVIE